MQSRARKAAEFLFAAAAGTLLHFTYEWSGKKLLFAAFSAVNESTWEHMKLLFVPMLVLTAAGGAKPGVLAARAGSILAGLALIPILFYTCSGVLGFQVSWVNPAIFYGSVLCAVSLYGVLLRGKATRSRDAAGLLILCILALCFAWWTFAPPRLGLWRDPVTGGCGLQP